MSVHRPNVVAKDREQILTKKGQATRQGSAWPGHWAAKTWRSSCYHSNHCLGPNREQLKWSIWTKQLQGAVRRLLSALDICSARGGWCWHSARETQPGPGSTNLTSRKDRGCWSWSWNRTFAKFRNHGEGPYFGFLSGESALPLALSYL